MIDLTINSKVKREVIDITNLVGQNLDNDADGVVKLFLCHTSAAITTADLDPGTDMDMLDVMDKLIPDLAFRHPHDPSHVPDHILSSMIGTSMVIPYSKGQLVLGPWQRVVLIELNGPRERSVKLVV